MIEMNLIATGEINMMLCRFAFQMNWIWGKSNLKDTYGRDQQILTYFQIQIRKAKKKYIYYNDKSNSNWI